MPAHTFERFPLTTVVLNVNTGCNLSCTYCCQGRPPDKPSAGRKMVFRDRARRRDRDDVARVADELRATTSFFGGEPPSNLPLIKDVVAYCEARFAELRFQVDFVV